MMWKFLIILTVTCVVYADDHQRQYQEPIQFNDLLLDDTTDDNLDDIAVFYETPGLDDVSEETSEPPCPAANKRNTDLFVDAILEKARSKIPQPAILPDRKGRFRLFNGTVENLPSVERIGQVFVRCEATSYSFVVPVGFQNLTGRYNWEVDTGLPVFRGILDLFIAKLDAKMVYTRLRSDDLGNGGQKAFVESVTINRLEGVHVDFDGLGPVNRVASRLTNLVARFFSRGLSRLLEGPVKKGINKELRNVEKYEKYFF